MPFTQPGLSQAPYIQGRNLQRAHTAEMGRTIHSHTTQQAQIQGAHRHTYFESNIKKKIGGVGGGRGREGEKIIPVTLHKDRQGTNY